MALNVKPIPTGDTRGFPFSVQEWMRTISTFLYSPTGGIPVSSGGTGLTSGTSGGILGFIGTTTIASSVLLTNHALIVGGGAGATPVPLASLGTATTVLHGNATGNPTFGAVNLTSDVSNILPFANGGFGFATSAQGDLFYSSAINTPAKLTISSAAKLLRSDGTVPVWSTFTIQDTFSQGDILRANAANSINPLSIGASGKFLQSNGTDPLWSAFTFPLTVGATGTILRSDGTNWVASTATYPNTTTINQILYSTAGNIVGGNSALTFDGTTLTVGNSGSGSAIIRASTAQTNPASGTAQILAEGTITSSTGTIANLYGIASFPVFSSTGASGVITQGVAGFWKGYANPQKATAATVGISTLRGMRLNLASTGASPTGRITTVIGLDLFPFNGEGTGTQAMQVGQIYGLNIGNQGTVTGTATGISMGGAMGISVAEQSGGTSNTLLGLGSNAFDGTDYSIYNVSTKKNVHAGKTFLGGTTAPTAQLHLAAGAIAASSAPLKFISGPLQTTAEAGANEFLTDKFYGTITTGAARKEFTLNDIALTSGRVPFSTTNGRLTDDGDLTFVTDTLTTTKLIVPTSAGIGSSNTPGFPFQVFGTIAKATSTPEAVSFMGSSDSSAALGLRVTVGNDATAGSRYVTIEAVEPGVAARTLRLNGSSSITPAGVFTGPGFSYTSATTYTATNVTTDRSYDANATSIDELADVLGTLISDLRSIGLVL